MSFCGNESAGRLLRNREAGLSEASAVLGVITCEDGFEVLSARLDVQPRDVRASAELLSVAERQRATRFVHDRDRRRFIVARAQLRRLLGLRLGMRAESVELAYGARGKPALACPGCALDLCFNVSHCGDVAVFAFSHRRQIGIDVEAVRVIGEADQIAARFFSRYENEAYLALNPRDRPIGFLNCWTRKEAFIKAIGDGLYHPLDRFDVHGIGDSGVSFLWI